MKHSWGFSISLLIVAMGITIACIPALQAQMSNSNVSCLKIEVTNGAGCFTIDNLPTNAGSPVDLFFKTNLTGIQDWTWLCRYPPGQTNLVMSNLPPDQCFFMLGVTNPIRPGFGQQILDRNDDGSTGEVPIGFVINFLGSSNATLYVNNNGNVTFGGPLSDYAPDPLNSLGMSIMAPYWADVDTRNSASGVVQYGTNLVDGNLAFGVDWVNVGYYAEYADKLLSCQLVIINRSDIGPGDFDMEFNYFKVQWEWGDASIGYPPRAGYSDGTNDYELPGSGVEGAFLDTNAATGLIYQSLNSSVPGRYIFFFRDGQRLP